MLQPFSSSPSPNVQWLLSATSLLFLCNLLLGPSLAQLLFQLDGPQPCPDNPIRLPALRTVQYIYSPYDEQRNYPADTDCQFLIEVVSMLLFFSSQVNQMSTQLPGQRPTTSDPSECDGQRIGGAAVHGMQRLCERHPPGGPGGQRDQPQGSGPVVRPRWVGCLGRRAFFSPDCSTDFPASISSASDSLLVHFHSDSVVQKRGFNISFVQFGGPTAFARIVSKLSIAELPGCPPDWKSDTASHFCYKLFVLPHILTWFEAQKECNFERANLATFRDEADYAFVFGASSIEKQKAAMPTSFQLNTPTSIPSPGSATRTPMPKACSRPSTGMCPFGPKSRRGEGKALLALAIGCCPLQFSAKAGE